MLVPRLEDIVLSVTIRQQWLKSCLPAVLTKILRYGTRKDSSEFNETIADIIEKYRRVMSQCPLPGYLQQRWAVIFNGLVREALDFLNELKFWAIPPVPNLGFLADMIVFTQNCAIDTTKTILTVLERKEMGVMFRKDILLNHFVLKEDLMRLLAKLDAQIEERVKYRSAKIITKERQKLQNAYTAFADYKDIKEVLQQAVMDTHKKSSPDACLGILNKLSSQMHHKLLECWMEMYCQSTQDMIDFATKTISYYKKQRYALLLPPKVTMLFLEYLGIEKFIQATNQAPETIFRSLLGNWQSRNLCAGLFQLLLPLLDAATCGQLLQDLAAHLAKDLQVIPLLRHIWNDIPKSLKENMADNISKIIGLNKFHPALIEFLKDYKNDSVRISSMLMLSLDVFFMNHKLAEQDLDILRKLSTDLKKMFGERRDYYLEESQLKKLLTEKMRTMASKEMYDALLSLSREDAASLKSSLIQDLDFIRRFLDKHWGNIKILGFFHWLFDEDKERPAMYLQCIENQVLRPLLALKLSRGCVRFAVGGLTALGHPHSAALADALASSSVKTRTIARMLNSAANTRLLFNPANWAIFLSEPVAMESLLLSAEGKKLILNTVTKKIKGLSTTFDENHLKILQEYKNICERLLTPTGLCVKVEAFLAEWGHPNAREAGGGDSAAGRAGRVLTDFRYRSLRAVVAGAARGRALGAPALPPLPALLSGRVLLPPSANSGSIMTATEVSIALAVLVDLKVPVVF